jgi:hypothetical protein
MLAPNLPKQITFVSVLQKQERTDQLTPTVGRFVLPSGQSPPMPSLESYIPKVGDPVTVKEHSGRFVITLVNFTAQTADLEAVSGSVLMVKDVPWESLSYVEPSSRDIGF